MSVKWETAILMVQHNKLQSRSQLMRDLGLHRQTNPCTHLFLGRKAAWKYTWKNCGNTAIFHKSKLLFGLHLLSFLQINSEPSSHNEFSFLLLLFPGETSKLI